MRPVSALAWIIAIAMIAVDATAADPPAYNKTDTFEPGKKYTCVPTADRKNWDCSEAGKAAQSISNASTPVTSATTAPVAGQTAAAPPPRPPARSTLPSYLTSAAAENSAPPTPPPSTISATADHANARPAESFDTPKPTTQPKAAPVASTPPSKVSARPTVSSQPINPAPIARPAEAQKPREMPTASGGFMDLAGERFVIELARASSTSGVAKSRAAIHVPHGEVYELHLRQNGTDAWLLLWGTFDNVEAARAARSTLAQTTSAALGFPRRVAPLQAEARRVSP